MGNLEYAMHALHNLSDDDFKRAIILYQQLELPEAHSYAATARAAGSA
jgi:hypothetical protein